MSAAEYWTGNPGMHRVRMPAARATVTTVEVAATPRRLAACRAEIHSAETGMEPSLSQTRIARIGPWALPRPQRRKRRAHRVRSLGREGFGSAERGKLGGLTAGCQ